MKSKIPLSEPIDEIKDEIVKSKNNLLNLSILKHFWQETMIYQKHHLAILFGIDNYIILQIQYDRTT